MKSIGTFAKQIFRITQIVVVLLIISCGGGGGSGGNVTVNINPNDLQVSSELLQNEDSITLNDDVTTTSDNTTAPNNSEIVIEPEMVQIPSGCFDMGSPQSESGRSADEGPQVNRCIDEFEMGRTEVTFREYDAFTNATSRAPAVDDGLARSNQPVINVSWTDASDFAEWLSFETARNYRLPTEAEWEYAARGGTDTPFNTGKEQIHRHPT